MNKIDLKNKVAVVTGGAQGFGLAIVEKFLASDAKVIIWDKDKDVQRCLLVINARHGFGKVTDWSNELVRIINFPLGRTTWICVRGFLHSS